MRYEIHNYYDKMWVQKNLKKTTQLCSAAFKEVIPIASI